MCIEGFADELARQYGTAFARLSDQEKRRVYSLYESAMLEIVMHEYAHHFLDHYTRIKAGKLTRINAEFEADYYALMTGMQSGLAIALGYAFYPLAWIEAHTKIWAVPDYESWLCRARNAENIIEFIGIAPSLLVNAAAGFTENNSPAMLRQFVREEFPETPTALVQGSCGRIANATLNDAHKELMILYDRMDKDLEFLFAKEQDAVRTERLIRDLKDMTVKFRYMDVIAAKSMASMLRRTSIMGYKRAKLVSQIESLLDTPAVTNRLLSKDFGELLNAQGLAILQERTDLTAKERMDRSFSLLQRAVFYNPTIRDAWYNLAVISRKRGDCASAASFSKNAYDIPVIEFVDLHKSLKSLEFVRKMEVLSVNPEACRQAAANYHPYPGL